MSAEKGYRELPIGGLVIEPGNACQYETGAWRTFKPVWYEDRCIQCLFCWVYCPDNAAVVNEDKMTGFDYVHCKGCGICAKECPTKPEKAITMEKE